MIDRIRTPEDLPIYTFDQGVKFIERIIDECEHPAVIAIHGQPNSGKSTLCKKVLENFAREGKYGYMAYPDEIYSVPYEPKFYLLQDTPPHDRATRLIIAHFKRGPNARILIGPRGFLNTIQLSTQNDIANGDYNIIIENDHAARKPV